MVLEVLLGSSNHLEGDELVASLLESILCAFEIWGDLHDGEARGFPQVSISIYGAYRVSVTCSPGNDITDESSVDAVRPVVAKICESAMRPKKLHVQCSSGI